MPKKDQTETSQKDIAKFIKRHLVGGESIVSLINEYGISRGTAYNWLARHREKMLDESTRAGASPATLEKAEKMSLRAKVAELENENRRLRNKVVALMLKAGEI
jgi:transposase-like protein